VQREIETFQPQLTAEKRLKKFLKNPDSTKSLKIITLVAPWYNHMLKKTFVSLSHSPGVFRKCVFRSERSWIGIEVRSVFRIYSINRDALTFSTAF
jgi:hypothetical protein